MVDEIFDRGYQAARTQLNADVGRAFSSIAKTLGDSMTLLHKIEWSAPWKAQPERTHCN